MLPLVILEKRVRGSVNWGQILNNFDLRATIASIKKVFFFLKQIGIVPSVADIQILYFPNLAFLIQVIQ
jgi:hypothetical protein